MANGPTPPEAATSRFEAEALVWLPDVARFARSLARDAADADDLVQDTFLTAYRNWHQFRAGSECRAWLFTICRNRFLRLRGRALRFVDAGEPEIDALMAARVREAAHEDGLDVLLERAEIHEAVQVAIRDLPLPFREAALLVDVHDYSYEEASTMLGVPIGTVRSRLFRARRLLRERLLAIARDAGLGPARGGADVAGGA